MEIEAEIIIVNPFVYSLSISAKSKIIWTAGL
jgi:hypothetical protein